MARVRGFGGLDRRRGDVRSTGVGGARSTRGNEMESQLSQRYNSYLPGLGRIRDYSPDYRPRDGSRPGADEAHRKAAEMDRRQAV